MIVKCNFNLRVAFGTLTAVASHCAFSCVVDLYNHYAHTRSMIQKHIWPIKLSLIQSSREFLRWVAIHFVLLLPLIHCLLTLRLVLVSCLVSSLSWETIEATNEQKRTRRDYVNGKANARSLENACLAEKKREESANSHWYSATAKEKFRVLERIIRHNYKLYLTALSYVI
jgi:hypothetical protein